MANSIENNYLNYSELNKYYAIIMRTFGRLHESDLLLLSAKFEIENKESEVDKVKNELRKDMNEKTL